MIHASDTPPDGDFAAYVERLANTPTAAREREDLFKAKPQGAVSPTFAPSAGMASLQAPAPARGAISFLSHAKWAVVIWLATQGLARAVPGVGFLFIPALLAYAAWVIFKSGLVSYGDVTGRIRDLARQAVEEARKARQRPKK